MQIITNKDEWNKLLEEEFTQFNDIYFRYEYFELWEKYFGCEPEAIFWEDENVKIFYPYLIGKEQSKFKLSDFKNFDIITCEYGGPLVIPKVNNHIKLKQSVHEFVSLHKVDAMEKGCKSELMRFHPVFENAQYFDTEHVNDTIAIDLTQSLDTIWGNITKGHRYNIRKSIKEGCEVIIKNTQKVTSDDIDTFINLYYSVMEKHKAAPKYYYPREFIDDLFRIVNSILVIAVRNNLTIATSIFLQGTKILHYHLSGALRVEKVYPTDLSLWEVCVFGKKHNFNTLYLGGGKKSGDSLFRFKSGFSTRILPFYVMKHIFKYDT